MGAGDQAHIDAHGLVAAHPFELALLEYAQQFYLETHGNFRDFIEQQRPAVGGFETAFPPLHRAGEGAFLVTKKFALQQRLRYGRAVHFHEGLLGSCAMLHDGVGDDLLAGTAFSLDQHGGVGLRDLLHHFENVLHQAALAPYDSAAAVADFGFLLLAQVGIFAFQLAEGFQSLQHQVEVSGQNRLDHVIKQAQPNCFHRRLHVGVTCHENPVGLRCELLELAQEIETIAVLKAQIDDDQIEGIRAQRFRSLLDGPYPQGGVTL